jgi:membrane associated rhomboid family serine protease
MSIVTLVILIANIAFSIYAFNNRAIFEKYMFNAYAIKNYKQHYRFLSHAFIHADYTHLILNMYVLYTFGEMVEGAYGYFFGKLGTILFVVMYTGAIYASSFIDYLRHKNNPSYNAVGASGAVSAIVFSFILIAPTGGMGMIFIPGLSIPSWIFGALYLAYSFYMDKRKKGNVAHGAHAWGAVFGFLFTGIADLIIANPEVNERIINNFINQVLGKFL